MPINKQIHYLIIIAITSTIICTDSLYGMEKKVQRARSLSGEQTATTTQGMYVQEGAKQSDKLQQAFGLRADISGTMDHIKEFEKSPDIKEVGYEILEGQRKHSRSDELKNPAEGFPIGAFSVKTENRMGDNIFFKSYLIQRMLEDVQKLQKKNKELTFLDIGAGIGFNTELLLDAGVRVVANDLSTIQLAQIKYRLDDYAKLSKKDLFKHLYLNDSHLASLNFPENSFDGILISHVFHYLTPKEITDLLPKIFRWLKPGGRVYIQAFTINSPLFDWYKPTYEQNIKQGVEWPGFIENAFEQAKKAYDSLIENTRMEAAKSYYQIENIRREAAMSYYQEEFQNVFIEGLPPILHAHDLKTVTQALQQARFKIIDQRVTSFVSETGEHDPEQDTVMIIAEAPKN